MTKNSISARYVGKTDQGMPTFFSFFYRPYQGPPFGPPDLLCGTGTTAVGTSEPILDLSLSQGDSVDTRPESQTSLSEANSPTLSIFGLTTSSPTEPSASPSPSSLVSEPNASPSPTLTGETHSTVLSNPTPVSSTERGDTDSASQLSVSSGGSVFSGETTFGSTSFTNLGDVTINPGSILVLTLGTDDLCDGCTIDLFSVCVPRL